MRALLVGFAITSVALAQEPQWRVKKDVSPIDDSTTVVVSRPADDEITGWPEKTVRPVLVLRNRESRVEAYIVTGLPAAADRTAKDEVPCTVRFDKEKAVDLSLGTSTDGEAIFFPFPRNWIQGMTKHERLVFRFTPFRSAPQTTSFDLRGLADAIKPLEEAARWKIGSCEDLLSRRVASHASFLSVLGYCPKGSDEGYGMATHITADRLLRSPEMRTAALDAVLDIFAVGESDSEIGPVLPKDWGVLATVNKRAIPVGREEDVIGALREAAKKHKIEGRLTIRTADDVAEHPVRIEFTGIPPGFPEDRAGPDPKAPTEDDK